MIFFYSWQSDHPSTRRFLKECLEIAIAELNEKIDFVEAERIELDHDTKGVPGIPEIASTIFNKIEACDLFIADVSFVGKGIGKTERLIPNPNVLIELGYAIGKIRHERILLLMDTRYGNPEGNIPFDLAHRRHPVKFSTDAADRKAEQNKLIKELVEILGIYKKRAPTVQVQLEIELSYEKHDFNSITKQRGFNIDIYGTNKSLKSLEQYEVFVELPRAIVLSSTQTGKNLSEHNSARKRLQYPIDQKNPLPVLLPDKRVKMVQIKGIVSDHNLPSRSEIVADTIDVEFYADSIPQHVKSRRLSSIDPFRLMDIRYDDLEFYRVYKLTTESDDKD